MRLVLTGATGFLGAELARRLVESGHEVVGVVRRQPPETPSGHFEIVDCRDTGRLASVIRGSDGLVHGAGISLGPSVAEALRSAPVRRVVAVSSAAVSSRSRRSAATYRAGEEALVAAHPAVLLVRPALIYGSVRDRNVHHAIGFARRFRFLPLVGDGAARIQPVHVRDLAAAIAELVAGDATGVVHAGGAGPVSLREAAASILGALGLRPRVLRLPYGLARAGAAGAEVLLRRRVIERVDRMLEDRTVDNSRLITLTTVRPRPFAQGVREQVAETYG